jgi:hypothetical protein
MCRWHLNLIKYKESCLSTVFAFVILHRIPTRGEESPSTSGLALKTSQRCDFHVFYIPRLTPSPGHFCRCSTREFWKKSWARECSRVMPWCSNLSIRLHNLTPDELAIWDWIWYDMQERSTKDTCLSNAGNNVGRRTWSGQHDALSRLILIVRLQTIQDVVKLCKMDDYSLFTMYIIM